LQPDVRRALIRRGEIVERRQRALQVRTFRQLERVEAAACQIEQLIPLDLADRAQLAAELVPLAQQLRLAVTATFGDAADRPTATSGCAPAASARTAGSARDPAPADPRPHSASRRRRFHAA
jgi:hypothetical protein